MSEVILGFLANVIPKAIIFVIFFGSVVFVGLFFGLLIYTAITGDSLEKQLGMDTRHDADEQQH